MKIKNEVNKLIDFVSHKNSLRIEKKKFKDNNRKKIYSSINLTNSQIKEIDSIYKVYYGSKIPYVWHKYYTAYSGRFDPFYFPELLYIPEFERYMNQNKSLADVIENKNILNIFAAFSNIKMPKTIISSQDGMLKDGKGKVIDKNKAIMILKSSGEVFYKPSVGTSSGVGCKLLNFENIYNVKLEQNVEEFLDNVDRNFVIQEKIECHDSIKKIYSKSVNTFRIMTYRWKNQILTVPSVIRIGQGGSFLDNAHAGGMFVAINDDGTLHKKAYTESKCVYEFHPDTQVKFEGYKIEKFSLVRESAIRMHNDLPELGVINWDFTIDLNGEPILIEANVNGGGIWIFQMAHGKGPFGERTPEILKWLSFMNRTKFEEREKYSFGKIKE
ncbi:Uncharacterised protein [uncultured Clostridium sp.]|uniref:sugar-transfer associated ATP-grasp domain-containing protein n=1 Tax=uncultured Clostridium sp. TaxID=59620 RepID=UPI000821628F|nr:sugar-transfer associated ATP-grasp domain-containing protein [uncultured Clostridium sp.]SCJ37163.1 Uncharacterised protein [uncultured Clostridium sp.]